MARITWLEWGKDAFDRADREGKLILLWLTGSWCQWSREMERSTYTNQDVVALVSEHYIPIRVDSGRRPDIDLRYNQGGLPSNVIITFSGELVSGGTYFTPDQILRMLSRTREHFKASKDEIIRDSREATERLVSYERATVEPGARLDRERVLTMMRSLLERSFDAEYGGFGGEAKFPRLSALTFLLHQSYYMEEWRYRDMVMKTLDVIWDSSSYDLEEGGVFRCSATRDWSEPSTEKLLGDNLGFLKLNLETYQLTGLDRYRERAEEIVSYITTYLVNHEQGGFYGSQASDEQYYLMPLEQRRKRGAPPVETTIFTSDSGSAIATFCYAADVLDRPDLLACAVQAAERLLSQCRSEEMGMWRYNEGGPHVPGLLIDQVSTALGCVALGDLTGERRWLALAEALSEYMIHHLRDEADGKFRDAPEDPAALGNLKVVRKPFELNVEAVRLFQELQLRTGKPRYAELAKELLLALRQRYLDIELQGAGFAEAVDYAARPPIVAKVFGYPGDGRTSLLRRGAVLPYYPKKLVQVVDPAEEPEEISRAGLTDADLPTVLLFAGEGRAEQLHDPEEVVQAVGAFTAELRRA